MDTMEAFARGQAALAAGIKFREFDWDKAARLIRERKPVKAEAGLYEDMEWTGGTIYSKGQIVPENETYVYLASNWATPILVLDGHVVDCWRYGDRAHNYWPESARRILEAQDATK